MGTERNSQPQVLLEKKPGVLNEGKRVRVKALKRTLASHKEWIGYEWETYWTASGGFMKIKIELVVKLLECEVKDAIDQIVSKL